MSKVLAATLPLVLAGVAFAQTATVQGRVTDQTGALVPNAAVTATNSSSGVKIATVTNGQGAYTIPFLQPGTYNIAVQKPGFRSALRQGVKLDIDQVAAVDLALQVGEANQSVEVQASTPLLETTNAAVGQTMDNKTVFTLPLNGRDYTQLVTLGAGAAPNNYSRAKNGFSLNGSATFQNTMLLDGVDNNNYILGTDTGNINALTPSVDAVQEFKVETGNYSAQYGRSAGGVVSVSIKSGTNQIHGDVFEFLRNDALDANDFFANRAGLAKPPLRRNQFGGTVGGPIVKNHSFFFLSYQGGRQTSAISGAVTVPTAAMVQGNFGSTAIYNPFRVSNGLREPFPNNVVPANLMDPVGRNLAALYPAPNLPGLINNYGYNQSLLNNTDELDSRFDEQLGAHDTAFFRYSRGTGENDQGGVFASPGNGGTGFGTYPYDQPIRGWSMAAGETHIFTPSMFNELHLGYSHNDSNQLPPESSPLFQSFGIQGIPVLPGLNGLPQISVAAFSTLGSRTFLPNPKLVQIAQLNDNVSWMHGNHNLKFGGEVLIAHDYAGTSNNARSTLAFNGQFTSQVPGRGAGSALADMLLGQTSNASISTALVGRLRSQYYGFFINDNWRVTTKLTLNLGLRYDLQTPMWDQYNRMSDFDLNPASPTHGTLILAQGGSISSRSFSNLDTNNVAPRVGFAYQLTPKTVVRSAFGIFYGGLGYQDIAHTGLASIPNFVSIPLQTATSAAVSNVVLSKGFPAGILNPANAVNPSAFAVASYFPMPAVNQWNFSVERELPGQSQLTVSYVGSSTAHLMGDVDLNAPPPGPGAINPRRPFPLYGAITYQSPYGHSTYEGLQVTFQRRFRNGFSLLADYTWSHSLDNVLNNEDGVGGSVTQDPHNTAAEKASSGFDIPQRFVTSVIYQLPVGASGKFLGGSAITRAVFGGWQLGGIFVAQGGYPLTLSVSPNPANSTTPERPNRICNGNLSGGSRTVNRWYDTGCFAAPAPYTYGNASRGVIRSPGLTNLDALIDRYFRISERMNLEFRTELFNFTNSAHFGRPDMTIGTPQAGRITNDVSPNREIQFALRLLF